MCVELFIKQLIVCITLLKLFSIWAKNLQMDKEVNDDISKNLHDILNSIFLKFLIARFVLMSNNLEVNNDCVYKCIINHINCSH